MKVVLDSNILISDFWLKSPNFKILLESAKDEKIELFIPEIVLDEVINKFSQRINKAKIDINSEVNSFEKITNEKLGIEVSDKIIVSSILKFKKYLYKVIKQNKITIIPYPKTDHKYLAKKAMLCLKPFNTNEKGYRDCLIWENVKSLLSDGEERIATPEIIFLTNNNKDFTSVNNNLHDDLVLELEDINHDSESIIIYPNLSEFNEKVTKLELIQSTSFETKLINDEFWDFNLKSTIDKFLFKNFIGKILHNYEQYVPYANDSPTISTINDEYKIEKISVKKLNSKEYIVDVEFSLEVEVDFFMDKYDYYSSDDLNVNIIDSDWNDHVVHASNTIDLQLSMTLIINNKLECTSCQVNKIGDEYE